MAFIFVAPIAILGAEYGDRVVNLSTRAQVGPGANMMVSGFVINDGPPKKVLIRAIGPSLAGLGVTGVLSDPVVSLYDARGKLLTTSDDWSINDAATMSGLGAFALSPGSRDAALIATLGPGAYTAQVSGANGTTGVALVEIYDVNGPARLINLSTRGIVGGGNNALIAGLVIAPGRGSRRLLVRAAGPALARFNLPNASTDPALAVLDGNGRPLATNDNWGTATAGGQLSNAFMQAGAFEFQVGSKDAALVVDLPPGSFSVQVSGVGGTTGLALVEIYDLTVEFRGDGFLTSFEPTDNAIRVSPDGEIVANFGQPMDSTTISTGNFFLQTGNTRIPGTISYDNRTAVFMPNYDLLPNTTYTVTITTGVRNASGISPVGDYTWNFTTGDATRYEMTLRSKAVTDFVRDGTQIMQMGDYLYSYGGWTDVPRRTYNDVYRSNGDLSVWTRMKDAPWAGRHTFGMAKIGSTLYIMGGDLFNSVFDVWSSSDGLSWEAKFDGGRNIFENRILYGACSHNGALYVLGGQDGIDPPSRTFTDVWSSRDGMSWDQIATGMKFLGKNISGSCTSFNGRIWVVGGGLYDINADTAIRWNSEIWSSSEGVVWTQQPPPPWRGRQYTNICVWDNKLWMIGGYGGSNLADIWYLKKNGIWTQFEAPLSYLGRHATGVTVYNNRLVLTCGNYHNDCWVIEKK